MEILLLIGLAALWLAHQRLATRFRALEEEVRQLQYGDDPRAARLPESGAPAAPVAAEPVEPAAEPAPVVMRPSPFAGRVEEPTPEPTPAPAQEPAPAVRETLANLFESFVGGRLLIWIGGIALAVAGVFLVRYSIEIGLITPQVRMVMAAVFGLVLIGAGEFARSRPGSAPDPRIAQALVGAGVLVLYAAAYGSHVLYGLIGMRTASVLMIATTAAALVLSLRHGAPTAVMGLAGGFATPILVGNPSDTSVPLLTYLGLLDVALFAVAARRGWTWLAASAVLLSFGWTLALGFAPPGHALPAGVFILVLSVAASLLRAGPGWQLDFLRPAAIGLLQLALLIGRSDLGPAAWILFGLLSAACFYLAPRRPEYRLLPALALALAVALLVAKAFSTDGPWVREVAAGITLLFAAGSLPAVLRQRRALSPTLVACGALAAPAIIVRVARPEPLGAPGWGMLFLALGSAAALLALARGRRGDEAAEDPAPTAAAATALLLGAVAALDLLSDELIGSAWFLLALAAGAAAARLGSAGMRRLALIGAGIAAAWAVQMVPRLWSTIWGSLAAEPALAVNLPPVGRTLVVLALPVPLLLALWRLLPREGRRLAAAPLALAAAFATAAAYVLFKQIFSLDSDADFVRWGMAERTLLTQALFAAGWAICTGRVPIPGIGRHQRWLAGVTLTGIAAARLLWFDMLIHDPVLVDQWVGTWPVFNLIVPAYLLSAFWLYLARRGADDEARSGLWLVLFLAALVMGTMLLVRQAFHGTILTAPNIFSAESYGYSLAALALSIALLLAGIRLPDKALRLAGLLLLTVTIAKVFLIDAAVLTGVLRILSFLGLGIALIGIGKLYTTVLNAQAGARRGG